MSSDTIEISVISENHIIREGLVRVLERSSDLSVSVMDEQGNLRPTNYQRLLMIDVPDSADLPQYLGEMRNRHSPRWIMAMFDACDLDRVIAAFTAGSDGVVTRAIEAEPLVASIRFIMAGGKVIPSHIISSLGHPITSVPNPTGDESTDLLKKLSHREMQILRGLVAGYSNKVIANAFGLAEATMKQHVKAILRKLRLDNRVQVAVYAVTRGVQPPKTIEEFRDIGET